LSPSANAEPGDRVLETERLTLRAFTVRDAEFVLALLNEPGFLRYIGDRGVRTLDQAHAYIEARLVASYREHGFGPYRVELKDGGVAIGMCGLFRKPWLDAADLGYAFLARYGSRGYAIEAAEAVMGYACARLGFERVVAVTTPDNEASMRLLAKLGFAFERLIRTPDTEEDLRLFAAGPGWPTKRAATVSYG
jgi:RimJ/RimL family protein N-acetyltransferase